MSEYVSFTVLLKHNIFSKLTTINYSFNFLALAISRCPVFNFKQKWTGLTSAKSMSHDKELMLIVLFKYSFNNSSYDFGWAHRSSRRARSTCRCTYVRCVFGRFFFLYFFLSISWSLDRWLEPHFLNKLLIYPNSFLANCSFRQCQSFY